MTLRYTVDDIELDENVLEDYACHPIKEKDAVRKYYISDVVDCRSR